MEKVYIEERAVELAHYIIDTKDTVRGADCLQCQSQQQWLGERYH